MCGFLLVNERIYWVSINNCLRLVSWCLGYFLCFSLDKSSPSQSLPSKIRVALGWISSPRVLQSLIMTQDNIFSRFVFHSLPSGEAASYVCGNLLQYKLSHSGPASNHMLFWFNSYNNLKYSFVYVFLTVGLGPKIYCPALSLTRYSTTSLPLKLLYLGVPSNSTAHSSVKLFRVLWHSRIKFNGALFCRL